MLVKLAKLNINHGKKVRVLASIYFIYSVKNSVLQKFVNLFRLKRRMSHGFLNEKTNFNKRA